MTKDLYTSSQVAAIVNLQPNTIRQHAKRHNLGVLVTPRMRLFTEADIARLRELVHIRGMKKGADPSAP